MRKDSRISGVLLFGLHLECVDKNRSQKNKRTLKLVTEAKESTLTKRATKYGQRLHTEFTVLGRQFYHKTDIPKLESIKFTVHEHQYQIEFGPEDLRNKKKKLESLVCAMDNSKISRQGYRTLAAIDSYLPREYAVADTKIKINAKMKEIIPIKLISLETRISIDPNENVDISNEEITTEVLNETGKAATRNPKDILQYVIPGLVDRGVLDPVQAILILEYQVMDAM